MKRPPVGAYDPYITIASPGGKPVTKPRFRVLMSKSMWKQWENAVAQAGDQNIQQLWNHLVYRPDQLPLLGSVTRLKGGHMKARKAGPMCTTTRSLAQVASTTSSTPTTQAELKVTSTPS